MLAAADAHTASSGVATGLIVFIVVGLIAFALMVASTRRK